MYIWRFRVIAHALCILQHLLMDCGLDKYNKIVLAPRTILKGIVQRCCEVRHRPRASAM